MAVKEKGKGEDKLIRIRRKPLKTGVCGIQELAEKTGLDLDELFVNLMTLSLEGLIQLVLVGKKPVVMGIAFRLARDFPEVLEMRQETLGLTKPTVEAYEYLKQTREQIFGALPGVE